MHFWRWLRLVTLLATIAAGDRAYGQLPDAPHPQDRDSGTVKDLPRNFLLDQRAIWTSPARLRDSNAAGPALLVVAATLAIATDRQAMTAAVPNHPSLNNQAVTASNGLVGGFVALPAILYGMGRIHRDRHATETGVLGAEAMGDSLVVNEAMKLISQRERPAIDNAKGRFFQSSVGANSSFPSTHSVIAWSSAAVVASEYNGLLTQAAAYGLAGGVSLTRVLGRQHFPSDVVVGSAVGWMIGRYVAHKHRRAVNFWASASVP